jgi:serine protease Do
MQIGTRAFGAAPHPSCHGRQSRDRRALGRAGWIPPLGTSHILGSKCRRGRGKQPRLIGVQIQPVTSAIAEGLGMMDSKGALVAEPMADSPAAKAGILSGDVITALNGNPVKDARDLATQIGGMAPGAAANLTVWREGAEKSISVTLGEMPRERAARAVATPQPGADGIDVPKLGLMLAAAEHVAGGGSEGVVVVDIDPSGLASEHGFKAGDIILDVGGKKVVTPVDVRNAIRNAQMNGKRAVLMRLKSDEVTKFVAIPIARA